MGSRLAPLLLAVFVGTNLGYFLLDPEESRFFLWLGLYSLQFILLVVLTKVGRPRTSHILLAGLVARAILWFTVPVLESDYYRYLWDAHVYTHGINPYVYPPDDPALDPIETDYRFFIHYAHVPTIYPPLAQYVFALAHLLAPDSLLGLKIVLTLFDVATGLVLARWLDERGSPPHWLAFYVLNPLVLKEIANSAHLDSIAVFFVTLAVYLMCRVTTSSRALAWVALALGIAAKLYGLTLAPLFARCDRDFARHALLASGVLLLLYLPFASAGTRVFAGTAIFGEQWLFNASLFRGVAWLWERILPGSSLAPRLTVGLAFLVVLAWRCRALRSKAEVPEASVFVLGALLLLSPVVDAWYALWILPFAVLTGSVPWIAFSYLVAFAYAWFQSPVLAVYFGALEYVVLFTLLLTSLGRNVNR